MGNRGLEDHIYMYMYPMGCSSSKFSGLPKIHKANTSLRPIASSRGLVTYGVIKVLAKILKPLVGKSPHHVHSTKDFVERVFKVTLQLGNASVHMMWHPCSHQYQWTQPSILYRDYLNRTPHFTVELYCQCRI